MIDLMGRRFVSLLVVGTTNKVQRSGKNRTMWDCVCDCGQRRLYESCQLTGGRAMSCGCRSRELSGAARTTHGHTAGNKTTRTFQAWTNMKTRCFNAKSVAYRHYGGRGITICQDWMSFEGFLSEMGECPDKMTIERLDNNGGYCKDNCCWASRKVQNNNTRRNKYVTLAGERLTMSIAAQRYGLCVATVWDRLKRGWSDEQTFGLLPRPNPNLCGPGMRIGADNSIVWSDPTLRQGIAA